eukprot:scaffold1006_cov408-Prasinococcus_capsulatus_cf.AAC.20
MAPLRATAAFSKLRDEVNRGELAEGGFKRDIELISEARTPFRLLRLFIIGGLDAAALIALIITVPRFISILTQGPGDGDASLLETTKNLVIDLGGVVGLTWLFRWEQRQQQKIVDAVTREETLSRLPVKIAGERGKTIVEVSSLRSSSRPLIIAGPKSKVEEAMKGAERQRTKLLERGIIMIPIPFDQPAEDAPAQKGFGKGAPSETEVAAEVADEMVRGMLNYAVPFNPRNQLNVSHPRAGIV